MKGYFHSIESFSAVDGPGVRSVVFLQGCPLRCSYCHNPDTWKKESGQYVDSSEIIDQVARNLKYIQRRGGVTISGGEPTMQIDFLLELLKGFKKLGLHTAVDTSGYVDLHDIDKILDVTDLFIVDIKHLDPEVSTRLTGRTSDKALTLLQHLDNQQKSVWIRSVLLPGLTDTDDYIAEICAFVKGLGNVERFELLPCHNLAAQKYKVLAMENYTPYLVKYDMKALDRVKAKFDQHYGQKVVI